MKKLLLMLSLLVLQTGVWAQDEGDTLLLPAVQVRLGDGSVRNFGPSDGQMRELQDGAMAWQLDAFSFGDGSVRIDPISIVYKTDPFINWAVSVTALTSEPVSFVFLFTVPYAGGPYNQLLSNVTATLSSEGNGAAMGLTGIAHDSLIDSNFIVALATTLPDCAGTSSPLACGSVNGQATVATAGSGNFSSRLQFTLTEPRSSAELLGTTILQTAVVPEPQTYLLWLSGLLLVGAAARSRRVG